MAAICYNHSAKRDQKSVNCVLLITSKWRFAKVLKLLVIWIVVTQWKKNYYYFENANNMYSKL